LDGLFLAGLYSKNKLNGNHERWLNGLKRFAEERPRET
jgi:hypothetical protein